MEVGGYRKAGDYKLQKEQLQEAEVRERAAENKMGPVGDR